VFERQIDMDMAYNYSTLDETLANFHKREVLDSPMNCTKCKAEKPHTKRLSVFRLPPILVI
jgi:ubiquitin C-terminal hydrolase